MTEKKQQVHIRIDWDVYFNAKQQDINISGLVNNLLKSYLEHEIRDPKKDDLLEDIRKHEEVIDESKMRLVRLQAELLKIEEEEATARKECDKKAIQFSKGLKASGKLRDAI